MQVRLVLEAQTEEETCNFEWVIRGFRRSVTHGRGRHAGNQDLERDREVQEVQGENRSYQEVNVLNFLLFFFTSLG